MGGWTYRGGRAGTLGSASGTSWEEGRRYGGLFHRELAGLLRGSFDRGQARSWPTPSLSPLESAAFARPPTASPPHPDAKKKKKNEEGKNSSPFPCLLLFGVGFAPASDSPVLPLVVVLLLLLLLLPYCCGEEKERASATDDERGRWERRGREGGRLGVGASHLEKRKRRRRREDHGQKEGGWFAASLSG